MTSLSTVYMGHIPHSAWNKLPIEIRKIESPILFKKALIAHLWKEVLLLATLPTDVIDELDD